jgi:hypothetical protein
MEESLAHNQGEGHVAAGYFLSRVAGATDWTGTALRRISLAESHSARSFFPNSWALSWCNTTLEERSEQGAVFGIPKEEVPGLVAWADGAMGREFGAWRTFFTLECARAAAKRWLWRAADVELWGLGLKRELVSEYCRLAKPPPTAPGVGASGTCVAVCERADHLAVGGTVLGYEILKEDRANSFESLESLHADEEALFREFGVVTNQAGLVDSFESALACCKELDTRWAKHPSELTGWLPWLIVKYTTGLVP